MRAGIYFEVSLPLYRVSTGQTYSSYHIHQQHLLHIVLQAIPAPDLHLTAEYLHVHHTVLALSFNYFFSWLRQALCEAPLVVAFVVVVGQLKRSFTARYLCAAAANLLSDLYFFQWGAWPGTAATM